MNDEKIFELVELRPVPGAMPRWLARGRAYEDIEVGDSVRVIRAGEPVTSVVLEISSYGRQSDLLGSGWTGDLTLAGTNDVDITGAEYLLRGDPLAVG